MYVVNIFNHDYITSDNLLARGFIIEGMSLLIAPIVSLVSVSS